MIKEALSWCRDLVDAAHGFEIVDLGDVEDNGVYGVYDRATGTLEGRHPEAPTKRFLAYDLSGFITLVNVHLSVNAKQNAIVFVGTEYMEALLDVDGEHGRREFIRFPLTETPEYEFLNETPEGHTQSGFVRLLRVKLHRASVGELLQKVRHLKFQRGQDGESIVSQGTQSLTRQVTEQLDGQDGPLPETVVLNMHQYEDLFDISDAPFKVTCALEVDPTDDRPLRLLPLCGELEQLEASTRKVLVMAVEDGFDEVKDRVTVVAGTPTPKLA